MTKAGKILGVITAVGAVFGAVFGIRYLARAAPEEYACPYPGCEETFDTYEELKTHFETHEPELIEIVWD